MVAGSNVYWRKCMAAGFHPTRSPLACSRCQFSANPLRFLAMLEASFMKLPTVCINPGGLLKVSARQDGPVLFLRSWPAIIMSRMKSPQSGIFALGTASHTYLEFDVAADRRAKTWWPRSHPSASRGRRRVASTWWPVSGRNFGERRLPTMRPQRFKGSTRT